jgi:dTDP-4-dehydrorhamnose 3,5-epimerase
MIEGVRVKNLKVVSDERGRLMEMMRCDEPIFRKFGQVYLTTIYPQVVKAWHYHKQQTDNICCVKGMIKLVLYDPRPESSTFREISEFFIGEHNPMLVSVPGGIYHGWKCISNDESFVVCIPTEPYDYENPDEFRLPPDTVEIPYDWVLAPGKKHG